MTAFTEEQITQAMARVPHWKRESLEITRTFTFKNFRDSLAFVVHVGLLAERADHHPDIDIRYSSVLLHLSTHSAGGLTEKDFTMAESIDKVASAMGGTP